MSELTASCLGESLVWRIFYFLDCPTIPSEYLLQTVARSLGALNLETQLPFVEETRMNQHVLKRTDSATRETNEQLGKF